MPLSQYLLAMEPVPPHLQHAASQEAELIDFPTLAQGNQLFSQWHNYQNRIMRSKDGQMLVTCTTEMPGVTPEMVNWWFGWHIVSSERYQLWHPQAHLFAKPKVDRSFHKQHLARYLGNVSYVNEYLGKKLCKLAIAFHTAESLGIDKLDRQGGIAICAQTASRTSHIVSGHLVHLVVPTENGSRMMSAFWLGGTRCRWPLIGRLLTPILNLSLIRRMTFPQRHGQNLLKHCSEEMHHLARILPKLYQDQAASE
ncbi:DAPG hydrolase family protein [Ferrimonas aestuarii]|uniref:DAPG hydrolase PhiG domain-containing protein n=1 Tax=Ferrimonas aestuarii TaxID=2569539 RepID=A0A4V6WMT5_9GAMM|nr:hypothetical protein [Ferrimonas aestuarii]TKB56704.1 hypothetical protein FCL42_06110 [Ferrimonas aestuarii]